MKRLLTGTMDVLMLAGTVTVLSVVCILGICRDGGELDSID